jgi:probable phosphoglycerate mutase
MATRIIIARHGNTFKPNDTPLRVGAGTDIPLVVSGIKQAENIARYLKEKNIIPVAFYSGELQRTYCMANLIAEGIGTHENVIINSIFNEIDYGVDEAKTEEEVIARIGQKAIDDWNQSALPPKGWKVEPDKIIQNWQHFAKSVVDQHEGSTTLVVTSNGIARFAPYLTGDFKKFSSEYNIKLPTGAIASFSINRGDESWSTDFWNIRPKLD